MSSVCFFIRNVWCAYETWKLKNAAHSNTTPDIKKQSSGQPTDAGRHWTKFGHGWTKFGKRWILQPWWWVQVPLSPVALVPNCHASTCKHHCCKVVFARQTCMLCVKLTQFPALNSLCIVIGGIHQVFATPKWNRMLYVRETALPIQFLDHHACRF